MKVLNILVPGMILTLALVAAHALGSVDPGLVAAHAASHTIAAPPSLLVVSYTTTAPDAADTITIVNATPNAIGYDIVMRRHLPDGLPAASRLSGEVDREADFTFRSLPFGFYVLSIYSGGVENEPSLATSFVAYAGRSYTVVINGQD